MFKPYRRKAISELRPYEEGEVLRDIAISQYDLDHGSPRVGDMIARRPSDHKDQWLVSQAYFEAEYEPA